MKQEEGRRKSFFRKTNNNNNSIFDHTNFGLPFLFPSLPLQGPADTCYENGTFRLDINVPEHYPLVPPSVRFRTKIFHPNIHFKVRG